MHLRPESNQQPANRELYGRLCTRLILDGTVLPDGDRMLERRLPNGHTARLYDYWSFTLEAYKKLQDAQVASPYGLLLHQFKPVLALDIVTSDRVKNPVYNKIMYAYRPHDISTAGVINGDHLRSLADDVEESDIVMAALDIHRWNRPLPIMNAVSHYVVQQFIESERFTNTIN